MQSCPKKDLLRIVHDGEVLRFDLQGRAPGRGTYICRRMDCLETAIKKNTIGRNLKTSVTREECAALIPQMEEILKQASTREVF